MASGVISIYDETKNKKNIGDNTSSCFFLLSDIGIICVCGQQPKIDKLIQQNNLLVSQNKKLNKQNQQNTARCLTLTDALNAKILGKPHDETFTEVEEFPGKEKLKKFSETAGTRDYIFVKLLMLELFPEGLKNVSLTGRTSNNPNGRKGGERSHKEESVEKVRLDPDKVKYIEGKILNYSTRP